MLIPKILKAMGLNSSTALFLASLFLFAPFSVTLASIAVGYLLNKIVGIGLFQSALLFITSVFACVSTLGFALILNKKAHFRFEWSDDAEDMESDPDQDAEDTALVEHFIKEMKLKAPPKYYGKVFGKVGRNEPCPCGSGKKYKACCLNHQDAASDDIPF